jgi:hypothetical protein
MDSKKTLLVTHGKYHCEESAIFGSMAINQRHSSLIGLSFEIRNASYRQR